jgi:phenylacetate-CoA ligase
VVQTSGLVHSAEGVVHVSVRTLFDLYTLKRNLRKSPSELKSMQTKKVKAIIEYAYTHVPFYHRKFDEARVRPDDITTIEDLTKIPITEKSEIQSASLGDVVADNIDLSRCLKRTTSGSTGVQLLIFIDSGAVNFEEALWTRTLLENGLRLHDKLAVLQDPRSNPKNVRLVRRFGIMRRKYISIFDDTQQQFKLIEKYKPHSIKSYSSSIALLAHFAKRQHNHIHPRLIFTGAEVLDQTTRKLISSTFKAEVFDNYACSDFGLLAWECNEHMGYHLNIDNVLMEFVDDSERVSPGEHGEIVCTGFSNHAMPLIRYRIADVGIPSQERCSCGRGLPLMKIVEGREDDFLVTLDGRVISPLIFFPYPFANSEQIKQFRVIQERKDRLVIQVVLDESSRNESRIFEKATREISRVFGDATQVEFQVLQSIERDPSGKIRKVISHVPINGLMNRTC